MKLRQTPAQIHLLALAYSDLTYIVANLTSATVSWFCDPCLPCQQLGRCYAAILFGAFLWATTASYNRALTLYITWLRARAIQQPFHQHTVGQNRKKHRIKSRLIIHCSTSERCERTSERTSEWPSTSVCIFGYSGPQWRRENKKKRKRKRKEEEEEREERRKEGRHI